MQLNQFWVAVTGPNDYEWYGHFENNGVILLENLQPGDYTVKEQAPGYPFTVNGDGVVTVEYDTETAVSIINDGSTTSSTGGTETTSRFVTSTESTGTTGTTTARVTTTVFGFTSDTVFGWVMEPGDIQTGFGGTAGGGNTALLILVLSGTLLASVLVASAVGVRAGIL